MEKQEKQNRLPYKKEELLELIWCDIMNGVSRYQIKLKLERDAYEGYPTSTYSRSGQYKLIKDAYDKCEIELQGKRDELRKVFYDRFLSLYNDCIENGDRRTALETLKYITKLSGLEEPEKIELSGTLNENINITFGFNKDEEENETD